MSFPVSFEELCPLQATYEDDDDTKDKDEEGDVIEDEEPAKGEDESDEVSDISDGESEKPSNRPVLCALRGRVPCLVHAGHSCVFELSC